MNKNIKHQYKDRVFQDLFSDSKNQLDLYKSLHPEDTTVNENDIKQITLHPIFVNDIYNDLGLLVNNSLMMFIEAQSTWSVNILVRLLIYLGQSLQQYIEYKKIEPYTSTPMPLPNIEFYVIYTGDKEHVPHKLKLSEEFFGGKILGIELIANIIYDKGNNSLLGQYISFCKVLTRHMREHRSVDSALKGINECISKGLLSEYLKSRKMEVAKQMNAMWTREEYDELRMSNKYKEGKKEGKQEAKIEMISKYMAKHNVSLDTALDDLDIPREEWEQYKKLIK